MKNLAIIILSLMGLTACDPYGFGFKKNPAYVLNEAFRDIRNRDVESFLEVSGKEALCIYGNPAGVDYLNENLNLEVDNMDIEPKMLTEKRLKAATWASGYWSYHNQRYMVNINVKDIKKTLVQVVVDCDFGTDHKDPKYLDPGFKWKKFKTKECKLVKIIPVSFAGNPLPAHCANLKVNL